VRKEDRGVRLIGRRGASRLLEKADHHIKCKALIETRLSERSKQRKRLVLLSAEEKEDEKREKHRVDQREERDR